MTASLLSITGIQTIAQEGKYQLNRRIIPAIGNDTALAAV
jgi:hypothetical protein